MFARLAAAHRHVCLLAAVIDLCVYAAGEPSPKGADGAPGAVRERPDLRMVAFADGTRDDPDEDKQRLRADNIQDSVVIIRSRLASGQLPEAEEDDDGSQGSSGRSSGAEEHSHTEAARPQSAADQQGFQVVTSPPGSAGAKGDQHNAATGAVAPAEQHSAMRRGALRTTSSKRVSFVAATIVAPAAAEPYTDGGEA